MDVSSIDNKDAAEPGLCVLADQIVSAQPGLIPQTGGSLTANRLWGATIYTDHKSRYRYVHLMRNFTGE